VNIVTVDKTPAMQYKNNLSLAFIFKIKSSQIKLIYSLFTLYSLFMPTIVYAQVIPDKSLPIPTRVTNQDNTYNVDQGTIRGSNWFNSFNQFSIPSGSKVIFLNGANIKNIINRVTGNSKSNIDGDLIASWDANVFLINPNGIIFGPNARILIGGSFLASTASSITFDDGFEYSAVTPQTNPLLTINIPTGLKFTQDPGSIDFRGKGQTLIGILDSPVLGAGLSKNGLRLNPKKTLGFVGGDINLIGEILTASNIEVGSVGKGSEVRINSKEDGFILDYSKVDNFKDINLSQRSLLDSSGTGSNSIRVQGKKVTFTDGSLALIQNQGATNSDKININATESLYISGSDPISLIIGSLLTETTNSGSSADIYINTPDLIFTSGGSSQTRTFSSGKAGDIFVNAPNSINLLGSSPLTPRAVSNISSFSFQKSSGKTGDITLKTNKFFARDGGIVATITRGLGNGGDINIEAYSSIKLSGLQPITLSSSGFNASTLYLGRGGKISITTPILTVLNGSRIDSSTAGLGPPGSISINTKELELNGYYLNSANPSSINSSANFLNESLIKAFNVPNTLNVSSGNIFINTDRLRITDGAQINVSNDGKGDAGNITINGNSAYLDGFSSINGSSASGNGGNVYLNFNDYIVLKNNSKITTSAGLKGNGGNIQIKSKVTFGDTSSKIIAKADQGLGGNIKIDSSKIKFSFSNISAASNLEANNGNVQINATKSTLTSKKPTKINSLKISFSSNCTPGPNKKRTIFSKKGDGRTPEHNFEPIENLVTGSFTPYYMNFKTKQKFSAMDNMVAWTNDKDGKASPVADSIDLSSLPPISQLQCSDKN
jgi:filamentous hemagglutinin family protein